MGARKNATLNHYLEQLIERMHKLKEKEASIKQIDAILSSGDASKIIKELPAALSSARSAGVKDEDLLGTEQFLVKVKMEVTLAMALESGSIQDLEAAVEEADRLELIDDLVFQAKKRLGEELTLMKINEHLANGDISTTERILQEWLHAGYNAEIYHSIKLKIQDFKHDHNALRAKLANTGMSLQTELKFHRDATGLQGEGLDQLMFIARALKEHPRVIIRLEGYSTNPSQNAMQQIATARAQHILDQLVMLGVKNRMQIFAFGKKNVVKIVV